MSDKHDDAEIDRQVAQFRELLVSADPQEVAAAMTGDLAPAPSRRRAPRFDVVTYRVHVALDGVDPAVWRLIEVPNDVRLAALHPVVQAAMGWTGSHLHQFSAGDGSDDSRPERYLTAADLAKGEVGVPEAEVRLDELFRDPGDRLDCAYDSGDGWQHTLTLDAVLPREVGEPSARCVGGAGACPPEDLGDPDSYAALLETARRLAAGDGVDVEDAELLTLTFPGRSPEEVLAAAAEFDVEAADDAVGRAMGRRSGQERRSGRERRSGQKQGSVPTRRSGQARRSGETRRTRQAGGSPGEVGDLAAALASWADGPYAGVVVEMVAAARLDEPATVAAEVAERMVAPFAWMVRHVGAGGVDLTSAGYLHPADVVAVAEALDVGQEWHGGLNREGHTLPVLAFRQACQSARLLRLAHGRLNATRIATRLADDPVAMWWHLAARLPLGGTDVERDAGTVLLLDVACHGDPEWPPPHLRFGDSAQIDDHLAAALHALGWAGSEGETLQSWQVRSLAEPTVTVLERLGVYQRNEFGYPTARPTPEGVAFARAVLRGKG